jgi:hypothetical protein
LDQRSAKTLNLKGEYLTECQGFPFYRREIQRGMIYWLILVIDCVTSDEAVIGALTTFYSKHQENATKF